MKQPVFFLSVLLALWIAGASYWYVCKVRSDCKATTVTTEEIQGTGEAEVQTPEQILMASIDEAKAFISGSGVQKGFFASSSATGDMSGVSTEYLEKLKLVLDNNPSAKIEVTGHADITGPEAFNRELGLRRAGYVKTFLVNAGINADQIMTSSKGSSEPAAPNNTAEGRAANRRTEIKIII
ncbi:MAG: OmpA family protein [Bacteroidales bacterium]|nr:OmpA family protein [Bacteroidales bacterium]